MYDIVDDGNALYLVKMREGEGYQVVATFTGEPNLIKGLAFEMRDTLNAPCQCESCRRKNNVFEGDSADAKQIRAEDIRDGWKPASDFNEKDATL